MPTGGSQPSPRPAAHLSATQRAPSWQAEALSLGGVQRRCALPGLSGLAPSVGWAAGPMDSGPAGWPWAPGGHPPAFPPTSSWESRGICLRPASQGCAADTGTGSGVSWLGALQAPNPPTSFLKGGLLITVNHKGVQTLECHGPRGVVWTCPILPDSPGLCPHIRERPRPEPGPQLPFWPKLGPGEIRPAAGGGTQKGL